MLETKTLEYLLYSIKAVCLSIGLLYLLGKTLDSYIDKLPKAWIWKVALVCYVVVLLTLILTSLNPAGNN